MMCRQTAIGFAGGVVVTSQSSATPDPMPSNDTLDRHTRRLRTLRRLTGARR